MASTTYYYLVCLVLAARAASAFSVSVWKDVVTGPADSILGIAQAFRECTNVEKVNLCVGAYRDDVGRPWVLPTVLLAEEMILQNEKAGLENKEYLPIEGDADFIRLALDFAYGQNHGLALAGVQALSGTGACRIAGEFLAQFWRGNRCVYIPVPTWGNHWKIFQTSGLKTLPYRYYGSGGEIAGDESRGLDFHGMIADLEQAPQESIILLHGCAHNPTGLDPTKSQWEEIARICLAKQHLVLFDSAYQGFASGDPEQDAWSLRYFVRCGIPVMLAQSFAKNFGLYGERCGTFSIVCESMEERMRLLSQLKGIIRPMYSSPPKHGALIVKQVLSDDVLREQYFKECQSMAVRMQTMRSQLVTGLAKAGSTLDWSHLLGQIGMFAYTGYLDPAMCDTLTNDHAIYLTRDGRISLAGLNESNLARVAAAIHAVTSKSPATVSTI